jgi:hypothetical protein
LLAVAGKGRGGRLLAEALRPGGSKKRELFDPDFNDGGKPSKASPAKVNLACRFMGGYSCRFYPKF